MGWDQVPPDSLSSTIYTFLLMRYLTSLSLRGVIATVVLFFSLQQAVIGQILYGLSNNNLISFKASLPGALLSRSPIAGVDAAMPLTGLDFRPATGELYALGYDPATGRARMYTLDLKTG